MAGWKGRWADMVKWTSQVGKRKEWGDKGNFVKLGVSNDCYFKKQDSNHMKEFKMKNLCMTTFVF